METRTVETIILETLTIFGEDYDKTITYIFPEDAKRFDTYMSALLSHPDFDRFELVLGRMHLRYERIIC